MTIAVTCCLRFSSDNTWEPLEHLNCDDLVKAFEEGRNRTLKKKTVDEMVYFFVVCHSVWWLIGDSINLYDQIFKCALPAYIN